jgi:hypothetical protein
LRNAQVQPSGHCCRFTLYPNKATCRGDPNSAGRKSGSISLFILEWASALTKMISERD